MKNSIEGYARTEEITAVDAAGLARSCKTDGITTAPGILGIERIEARFHGHGFSPHRHDTYAIGLTISGVQTFTYRGCARASLPGQIIVLHPDELHDGAAGTEDGLTYRMLYLPPERLVDVTGRSALPFVADPVVSDEGFRQRIAGILDDLDTAPTSLAMDDLLEGLAAGLVRHADDRGARIAQAEARIDFRAMLRCRDHLRENHDRNVSSEELEVIGGLDRFQTARQFRRMFGTSPHRYLVLRRLDRARQLMTQGSGIADVAATVGFSDQAHFTRHFRKAFGMTPGRWLGLTIPDVDRKSPPAGLVPS